MSRVHYTPTYQSWQAMRQRCLNPRHVYYANYGGRGVTIDPRWNDYHVFLADMGERPTGTSLERKNTALGYGPKNCRWATRMEQNRNSSQNRLIAFAGSQKCLAEWCEIFALPYDRTYARLYRLNWTVRDAFFL